MSVVVVPTAPNEVALTVYFDGSCPLCLAEIGVYRDCRGSEQIAFVDVSVGPDQAIVPGLDRASAMARFHVMRPDGTLDSGAAGFGRLWLSLPGWRWLGRLVMLPFLLPLAEVAYGVFLLGRPALQRLWRWRASDAWRAPPRTDNSAPKD
jgi:predicted DCC family thiol-disulfide oxidoreductase YuxK